MDIPAALEGRPVLITGGAGFIGSHLVRSLARSCQVRVLDDESTGNPAVLADVRNIIDYRIASVLNEELLAELCTDAAAVFHLAAMASVPGSIADPVRCFDVNVGGTARVLDAARKADVKRVVFAGSAAVYGDGPDDPKTEELPTRPQSPYGVSKVTGEDLCRIFQETYGLGTSVLRYFNVYGTGQDPASPYAAVIPIFIDRIKSDQPVMIEGDGLQTRDFVHVSDVVRANLMAATLPDPRFTMTNIAGGNTTTINELAERLVAASGKDIPIEHGPPRQGDIRHSRADIRAAYAELGWEPKVTFSAGIKRTWDDW